MRRTLLLAGLLCLGGCGSYYSYDIDGCRIYGGVRYDCGDTEVHWSPDQAPWPTVVAILSFPFDFVVDTIFLPFTAIHVAIYGEPKRWDQ